MTNDVPAPPDTPACKTKKYRIITDTGNLNMQIKGEI